MPAENSSSSRSTAASGSGRGRRRAQPIELEPPFIDVEAIDDDDVTILSPSQTHVPASNVSRRRPLICLDDDDDDDVAEVNHRHSGVAINEEVRIVSGNNHNKRVRISPIAGGSGNKNIRQTRPRTRNKVIQIQQELPQPVPVDASPPPPPKEPNFGCPVCLNQLNEPCSTTCGHVFCQSCIKASIQAQKKCPTCRKKLNKNSFHRLYLPNTV